MPARRPIRILRLVARLNIGGPAVHLGVLAEQLHPPDYETLTVTGAEGADEGNYFALMGRDVANLRVIPALGREIHPLRDLATLRAVLALIREFRPDIVDTHTAKAGTLGRLAAWWCRVPAVHTFHGHVFHGYFSPMKTRVFVAIERWLARQTACLIAVSEAVRRDVLAAGVGTATRFEVVSLGLDLAPFEQAEQHRGALRRDLGLPADVPLIGIVARLVPIKQHELFLDVAARLVALGSPAHLVIVGDGECRAEVERGIAARNLGQRVHLVGWRSDLPVIYADCDVVLLTSKNEGSPVALIEAHAAACPVVATRVGGVPDVVVEGETGWLCDDGDVEGLAAATARLLSNNDERRRFGAAGRRRAVSRFGAARLGRDMDRLYRSLLEGAQS